MYVIFCCTVDRADLFVIWQKQPDFWFSVRFDGREVASPSFSALVVSFYASRFGLYPNSGNRQERITLSSVSDKHLM